MITLKGPGSYGDGFRELEDNDKGEKKCNDKKRCTLKEYKPPTINSFNNNIISTGDKNKDSIFVKCTTPEDKADMKKQRIITRLKPANCIMQSIMTYQKKHMTH
jgi:hypothetical protein